MGRHFEAAEKSADDFSSSVNQSVTSELSVMGSQGSSILDQFRRDSQQSFSALESDGKKSASSMSSGVASQFGALQSSVSQSMAGMQLGVQSSMSGTASATSAEMAKMTQVSTAGLQQTQAAYAKFGQDITSTVQASMGAVTKATAKAMSEVAQLAQSGSQKAVEAISSGRGGMQSAGYNAGMGFYYGLSSTAGSIYALARSIAYNVAATLRSALRVRSPSKITAGIGGDTGAGLVVGLEGQIKAVTASADRLAEAAIPEVNTDRSRILLEIRARTSGNLDVNYSQEISVAKQPAYLYVNIGGTNYRKFVKDIHDTHDAQVSLELAYT